MPPDSARVRHRVGPTSYESMTDADAIRYAALTARAATASSTLE